MNEQPLGTLVACERSGAFSEELYIVLVGAYGVDVGFVYKMTMRGAIEDSPSAKAVVRALLSKGDLIGDDGRLVIGDRVRAHAADQLREAIEKGGSANGHSRPEG